MDLSWSHVDRHMLATCGADKQLLVWDTRAYSVAHRVENAHSEDVRLFFRPSHSSLAPVMKKCRIGETKVERKTPRITQALWADSLK